MSEMLKKLTGYWKQGWVLLGQLQFQVIRSHKSWAAGAVGLVIKALASVGVPCNCSSFCACKVLRFLSAFLFPSELTIALSYHPSENWTWSFETPMVPASLCVNYF